MVLSARYDSCRQVFGELLETRMVASACYSLLGIRISLLRLRIALFSVVVLQPVQAGFRCFSAGSS